MKTEYVGGEIVRTGSANVFADLGLPNPEERLLKAQLMNAINKQIRQRALTQTQAGKLAGLKQPELSRIANGRGSGFSVDRLIEALRHLGRDVEITVSPASGSVGELHFRELASHQLEDVAATAAARKNGKKGGRPRKTPVPA